MTLKELAAQLNDGSVWRRCWPGGVEVSGEVVARPRSNNLLIHTTEHVIYYSRWDTAEDEAGMYTVHVNYPEWSRRIDVWERL